MDLTVEVMLPRRGATGAERGEPANPRWRLLALVAIYPLKTVATVGMPCTGYIHITDIPERPQWSGRSEEQIIARLNANLCKSWLDNERFMVEKREWAGIASAIPTAARNALLDDRQISVTWAQFKAFVENVKALRGLDDADLDD